MVYLGNAVLVTDILPELFGGTYTPGPFEEGPDWVWRQYYGGGPINVERRGPHLHNLFSGQQVHESEEDATHDASDGEHTERGAE